MSRTFATGSQPIQRIYGSGTPTVRTLCCEAADATMPAMPTIADLVSVTEIMTRDLTCARKDLPASQLVELMIQRHVGCVPVVDARGQPVGMVTKLDLVEQLIDADDDPRTAGDLMMPLAITLGERASVAHAAQMMTLEDIHHVAIVNTDRELIGLVSSMDIVRWLARNDGYGGAP
jgi:CBS domain-containing protein